MPYKYGTYGEIVASIANLSNGAETIPVYIGTAPVHLISGWQKRGLVNQPIKVKSLADAQKNVGYCPNFADYTLCEAIAAHYDSGVEGIGPIYMINVLDPAIHKSGISKAETLNFVNGRALIPGTETILDSVKIARPVDDPAPIGCIKTKADANTALSSVGKQVTDAGDNTFYLIFDEPLDQKTDYLLVIEANGKSYGLVAQKAARAEMPNCIKIYCQLNDGKMVDFVDGVKVDDPNNAKLDLDGYTGEIKVSFYSTDEQTGKEEYPTGLELVRQETLTFVDGVSPQYYEPGEDYEIAYNATRGGMYIQDLGAMPKNPTVTYELVDPAQVTAEDIVGDVSVNGELSGIEALKLLFLDSGEVANVLAAPGWSDKPEVCAALSKACRKINGHWDAMYVVDIPLTYEGEAIDTMDKAVKWKQDRENRAAKGSIANSLPYNDERSKVCWPQAIDIHDRVFHISTLVVATMLRVDQENDGIPMETPANKSVPIIKQYFGGKSRNAGFDQRDADGLVSKGITTVVPWATDWQIWGDHTAAYDYDEDEADHRTIFDVSMRMLMHITNSFQREWAPTIDEPMTRALIDTIVNREQEKLDQLVSIGALVGKPTISFSEEENTQSDLVNGNFTFDIAVTPTPPLKSATVKVCYTDEGFSTYWGEE